MNDGIQWMVGATTSSGWMLDVYFARGIDTDELASRMGAPQGAKAEPMTDAETADLDVDASSDSGPDSAVVRIGEHAGWAYAITYGPFRERLEEVSRDGVEAVHYHYNSEHPPTIVMYARDGRTICGYGLCEERHRYGQESDLLLPDLVAAGVLHPGGETYCAPDDDYDERRRRGLAVFEKRFGLSLPRTVLTEDALPVYAIMGSPHPDFDEISAWAAANGRPRPNERLRLIPVGLRREYERVTDPLR
ncbi:MULTISPECIES: hypothetical protein [unclassified Streptomyces]|uniref:DUF6461 domain-containing protein n=1 Tax=unclassified Streptomyces TaxID=2593676 RepID=UPI0001C1AC04|nr:MULTISPECIES: hypothetical protein [unclassified Streptomyces]MYR65963.1 hypothetical protein [Streptomyces sp. SID4939]MYR99028.1 hypothetical protein [Streptomyces sp. SID4940]MYT63727.1 hypothetical protein [Streptomyces sp. SID8357]MYT85977.1 hypothetical protein [Streptomyces sp. SID8360]MYW38472.1 hypothetical protein [Streptomyces sp. SID1]